MKTVKSVNKIYYKYCIEPKCRNTTITAPNKLFFSVPHDKKIRTKWCKIMKRKGYLSEKSARYCCEDHFDLETDMLNYIKFKLVGGRLKLKPNVVPHKFECRDPLKKVVDRPGARKRQQIEYFNRVLSKDIGHEDLLSRPIEEVVCNKEETNTTDSESLSVHNDPIHIEDLDCDDDLLRLIEYSDDKLCCTICKDPLGRPFDIRSHVVTDHPKLATSDPIDFTIQDLEKKTEVKGCQEKTKKNKRKRPVKRKKPVKRELVIEIPQKPDTSDSDCDQRLFNQIDIIHHEDYEVKTEITKAKTSKEAPKSKISKRTAKVKADVVTKYIDLIDDIDSDFGKHVTSLMEDLPQIEKEKLRINIITLIFNAKVKHGLLS